LTYGDHLDALLALAQHAGPPALRICAVNRKEARLNLIQYLETCQADEESTN
jgi:hypothetical protein